MSRIVIAGGGWSGCAAAVAAHKAGAEVVLLERADTLLGTGQVGGIMRNNGRYTAAEEMIAMGAGDLFQLTDKNTRHADIAFPGHAHAWLYDVGRMEAIVRRFLAGLGIDVRTISRAAEVRKSGEGRLAALVLDSKEVVEGDAFVDTTGSLGPMASCNKYGNGCAMCVMRCLVWGGRVSIAGKAGAHEFMGLRSGGGFGAMSGACKLHKGSLSPALEDELNQTGVLVLPVPADIAEKKMAGLSEKCCQQYALSEFADNVVLLDTGHAKLMSPYYPLDDLRRIPGLEDARYEDPYAGGMGNSIRFLAMAPREDTLEVTGFDNLFCGGEKAGLLVGHTEAMVTGTVAGHNAARRAAGLPLVELPNSTAVGDFISYSGQAMRSDEGKMKKYTFSGSVYFDRMKSLGTYTTDRGTIRRRVAEAGATGLFERPLVREARPEPAALAFA
jgi:hypothetical protein